MKIIKNKQYRIEAYTDGSLMLWSEILKKYLGVEEGYCEIIVSGEILKKMLDEYKKIVKKWNGVFFTKEKYNDVEIFILDSWYKNEDDSTIHIIFQTEHTEVSIKDGTKNWFRYQDEVVIKELFNFYKTIL